MYTPSAKIWTFVAVLVLSFSLGASPAFAQDEDVVIHEVQVVDQSGSSEGEPELLVIFGMGFADPRVVFLGTEMTPLVIPPDQSLCSALPAIPLDGTDIECVVAELPDPVPDGDYLLYVEGEALEKSSWIPSCRYNMTIRRFRKASTGDQGPQGKPGEDGDQGPQGKPGASGAQGPQGKEGPQGPQGKGGGQGTQGKMGPMGPKGEKGDSGSGGAVMCFATDETIGQGGKYIGLGTQAEYHDWVSVITPFKRPTAMRLVVKVSQGNKARSGIAWLNHDGNTDKGKKLGRKCVITPTVPGNKGDRTTVCKINFGEAGVALSKWDSLSVFVKTDGGNFENASACVILEAEGW